MTAAHCAEDAVSFEVTAGDVHSSTHGDATEQVQTSTSYRVHEDWNRFKLDNDIALIYFNTAFNLNDAVTAIPLAATKPAKGTVGTAIGWGKTSDSPLAGVSNDLKEAQVDIDDNVEAEDYYGSNHDWTTKLCIDASNGRGTCNVRT